MGVQVLSPSLFIQHTTHIIFLTPSFIGAVLTLENKIMEEKSEAINKPWITVLFVDQPFFHMCKN